MGGHFLMRSKKKLYPLSEVYRLLESGPVVLVTTARAGRANVTPCRIVSPPPTTVCSRSKRRWPSCTACSAMPASSPTSPICGGIPSFPNCWALNGWPVNRHCHVSFRRGLDRLPSRKEGYTLDLESTRLAAQGWTSGRRWRAVTPSRGSGPVCIRCWRSSPRCGWWPSYLYALSLVWLNLSHYWYGVLPKWLAPH